MNNFQFFSATDVVVVGQDFEMADMSNPQGYIYGVAAKVVAEDKDGYRRYFPLGAARWEEEVLPKADKMAAALNARFAKGKLPVTFGMWQDDCPAYGSVAYQLDGAADDIAWEDEQERCGL